MTTTAIENLVAAVETKPTKSGKQVGLKGVLIVEGVLTGDGRKISAGALRWDNDAPMPIMAQLDTPDMNPHGEATLVGKIVKVERAEDGTMPFEAIIDAGRGGEIERLVEEGMLSGISADLDDVTSILQTESGDEINSLDDLIEAEENGEELVLTVTDARIRGGTITPMPAFIETSLEITGEIAENETEDDGEPEAIAAAAVTDIESKQLPAVEWFQDPKFSRPTDLHIDDDGHIYGHIALWGTCHVGIGGTCLTPPKTGKEYSQFMRHSVKAWCEDCEKSEFVKTGPLTAAPGHAPTNRGVTPDEVKAHYDDIKYGFADVAAGEDEHGIWINGRIRGDVSDQQIDNFRASGLSGDWRPIAGQLELLAVLAVNTPGYPIVKGPTAHTASAENGDPTQDSLLSAPRYFKKHRSDALRDELQAVKETAISLLDSQLRKSAIQ